MADFCAQCTRDVLGMDDGMNDMSGITSESDWKKGIAAVVLCEGCGPIQVNPSGECVSIGCDEDHNNEKHHIPWYGEQP